MKNIFDRAKLFFSKDREFRSALYDIMGFCPHNIDLYRTAFAHKTQEYRSKKFGNKPLNNERLEFLGDAVLETVVSHIVYRHFPNKREGFLTNTRSKIVSRESLGKLAKELRIDRLIQSQATSRTHNSYLGGNSFEALLGAIYLDRGYRYAFRFVEKRIIGAALDLEKVASKEVNFKSKLLEWSQKNRIRLDFKDTSADNGNGPSFVSSVVIEGISAGQGKGFSKKESHQAASKDALTQLRRDPQFLDSIFRAKEKRTAMGADEFFVLPKIEEIEKEIAQENSEKNRRNEKDNRPGRETNNRRERVSANSKTATQRAEQGETGEKKNSNPPSQRSNKTGDKEKTKETKRKPRSEKPQAQNNSPKENLPEKPRHQDPIPTEKIAIKSASTQEILPLPILEQPIITATRAGSAPTECPIAIIPQMKEAQISIQTSLTAEKTGQSEIEVSAQEEKKRTEQEKRRMRRQNKHQSAATYTNTTPPPAEQSHRAEKAAQRQQEASIQRNVQQAQRNLPIETIANISDDALPLGVPSTTVELTEEKDSAAPIKTQKPRRTSRKRKSTTSSTVAPPQEPTVETDAPSTPTEA